MTGHAARAHSKRSPSFSNIWRNCFQACVFADTLPEPPTSQAALDGTFAHEWAEHCLKESIFDASEFIGMTLTPRVNERALTQHIVDNINVYLGTVEKLLTPDSELYVEKQLSLAPYFDGTEDGDGTADCYIYHPDRRHADLIDYKNGFLSVAVEGNKQATQYALGLWEIFKERGLATMTIWIVQPNNGGVKRWDISALDLFDHGQDLKDDYAKSKLPDAPFVPGKHCTFCKGNIFGKCAAIREHAEREAARGFQVINLAKPNGWQPELRPDEIGDMLKRAEPIRVYLKALDELAESEARAGRLPVGRKWVQGRGKRVWNPDLGGDVAIAKAIQNLIPGAPVWEESLKTAPALEKDLGKKEFAKLAPLVVKTAGALTLVSDDDPREAVDYAARAAEGFEVIG